MHLVAPQWTSKGSASLLFFNISQINIDALKEKLLLEVLHQLIHSFYQQGGDYNVYTKGLENTSKQNKVEVFIGSKLERIFPV